MTLRTVSKKITLRGELSLIHWAGWTLAGTVLGLWMLFALPRILRLIARESDPPPISIFVIALTIVAFLMATAMLLTFYVNADAGRRGMNRLMWTLLVIFIPNGIGFIIYFVLRKPILASCPSCGAGAPSGRAYCSACGEQLMHTCPACNRAIDETWSNCSYCGGKLELT